MTVPPYPALTDAVYSDDRETDTWAKDYYRVKEKYYEEQLARVRRVAEEDDTLLDVGAAPFQFTWILQKVGFSVAAVDVEPSRFDRFITDEELDVLECDIEREKLPLSDGTVDVVLLTEVIEHLRVDPLFSLKEIHRVMSPEGLLFLTTPNQYRLPAIWDFVRGKGLLPNAYGEYRKLETVGHMGHVREYAPSELQELLEESGFRVEAHEFTNYGGGHDPSVLRRLGDKLTKHVSPLRSYQVVVARKAENGA